MAKKSIQHKEEKERKRQLKEGSSYSFVWAALAVVFLAIILAIPQLSRRPRAAAAVPDVKMSFPQPEDARPATCPKDVKPNEAHDSVSIIIPYLNEEWFRIEATMQSILKYTDMSLVREVMWVSDGNVEDKVFGLELRMMHPKVSVHENPKNLGLIMTKMEAAKRAQGSVLMFLEPHVVVNAGWLEPLLIRLEQEPKALIMPNLDALHEDLSYHPAEPGHWRFEWNLNLIYTNPSESTARDQPFVSPATSGGIYAIRKDWWDTLELFDPELVRWGGDHVEATHKVWRCGGRIEVHPCSRVGHWFREVEQRPYPVKVESVVKNYKRLVEVWFDGFKQHFYKLKPDAVALDIGDVTDMHSRRDKLQCKDMAWYLKNVDVELAWEANKICIPGTAAKQGGCGHSTRPAHRRSSILEAIPRKEYEKLVANAEAFRKKEPCCKAKGRGCKRICMPGEAPGST